MGLTVLIQPRLQKNDQQNADHSNNKYWFFIFVRPTKILVYTNPWAPTIEFYCLPGLKYEQIFHSQNPQFCPQLLLLHS